jgi:predicted transcriptional regulator
MPKYLRKPKGRDSETATRVKRTANICGVSPRTVYRVIRGDESDEQTVEKVLQVYMQLSEGESVLVETIKKIVPFN